MLKNGHMHVEVKNHSKILLYRLMFQILLLTFFIRYWKKFSIIWSGTNLLINDIFVRALCLMVYLIWLFHYFFYQDHDVKRITYSFNHFEKLMESLKTVLRERGELWNMCLIQIVILYVQFIRNMFNSTVFCFHQNID